MTIFSISRPGFHLELGERLEAPLADAGRVLESRTQIDDWRLPSRPLTAGEIVAEVDTLLRATLIGLGAAGDPETLLEGLRAVLDVDGRESALPVARLRQDQDARGALSRQADLIGKRLVALARDALASPSRFPPSALATLAIRSPCEGHVWTRPAAELLIGPAGGPRLMQIYNEWLHTLVLLRDGLLPFTNWETIRLPLQDYPAGAGLRVLEGSRKALLADLLTGKVPHERIVDHALTVLGVTQRSGSCYGFQVADGVVLPAVLNGNDERALLELYPAWIAHAPSGARLFRYALQDYYAAPRQALDAGSSKPPASAHGEAGRIRIESDDPDDTRLSLELVVDGHHCAVDLGQVLRGARFLYSAPQTPGHDPRAEQPVQWHSPAALLASSTPITPALVTADSGVHALAGDELTALALLGRIYPENIVLGRGEPLGTLRTAGKGFGPIFMIGDLSTALHSVELRTLA